MTDFSPELLQVLLEKVAATIQELYLDQCGIMDSQFEAILPALSRCSQLSSFSLCGNLLSMAVMEKMLRHTAGLSCLSQEWYPAPQESYSPQGVPLEGRLAQLWAPLMEIMRNLVQPKTIRIFPSPCPYHSDDICDHVEPIIFSCTNPCLGCFLYPNLSLGTWKLASRTRGFLNVKTHLWLQILV